MTNKLYQSFTYEQLARDYSYDHVGGSITSTKSGMLMTSASGVLNKRILGTGKSVRLQLNILAIILHRGSVVEGLVAVKNYDGDKTNLKLDNLIVLLSEEADESSTVGQMYYKPTTREGILESVRLGHFIVRGDVDDAVYMTKTFNDAVEVIESFEALGILQKNKGFPYHSDLYLCGSKAIVSVP